MRKKHAPTEVLSSSKKIYLQRKGWNSHKIKELNKLNHKTVTLHCYCGVNVKYGFLSKTLVSMNTTIRWLRKYQSNDKRL